MKILFVSTEVWSLKNPEGIVARKIVFGLLQNDNVVDVLSTKRVEIPSINRSIIINSKSIEILSKIRKKITGIEKRDFVNDVISKIDQLDISSYDLIITRSEPFFLHEIGYYIKIKYSSIKWVASFGDPVFLNPYNSGFFKKYIAKRLEQKYWKTADLITHTNESVLKEYKKNGFNTDKSFVLENPFLNQNDEFEIENYENKDVITFAYVGSLYGKRSISPVVKFLSQLDFNFKLLIIGGVRNTYYENRFGILTKYLMKKDMNKINNSIRKYNLQKKVTILPFMPKDKLDNYLKNNVDVLINIDACIGDTNLFLSSKIVEYLQYSKPILNFSIKGATVDFLKDVGVNYYIDLSQDNVDQFNLSDISKLIPSKNIANYTAKNIINRLLNRL